ncbi:hypothetical protein DY000_02041505 [Brassica cretica]|uniref:Uncharacterized protein n=1 Tax=Brassica cretica TaxID=69181 RepID=A0ABQ7BD99_BRACR|nr:hypothetical protein DY000_02041505 [Brassica cretica]
MDPSHTRPGCIESTNLDLSGLGKPKSSKSSTTRRIKASLSEDEIVPPATNNLIPRNKQLT